MRKETAVLFEEAWRAYKAEPHYLTAEDLQLHVEGEIGAPLFDAVLNKQEYADVMRQISYINQERKERYDDALDEALGKFVAAYWEESLCD